MNKYEKLVEALKRHGLTPDEFRSAMLSITCLTHNEPHKVWLQMHNSLGWVEDVIASQRNILIEQASALAAQSAVAA